MDNDADGNSKADDNYNFNQEQMRPQNEGQPQQQQGQPPSVVYTEQLRFLLMQQQFQQIHQHPQQFQQPPQQNQQTNNMASLVASQLGGNVSASAAGAMFPSSSVAHQAAALALHGAFASIDFQSVAPQMQMETFSELIETPGPHDVLLGRGGKHACVWVLMNWRRGVLDRRFSALFRF
jgi:uncharacterized protein with beta-barrel porin domain